MHRMGALSGMTFGEVLAALGRYRPVVIAVVVLVALLRVLPNDRPEAAASTAASVPTGPASVRTTPTTAGAAVDTAAGSVAGSTITTDAPALSSYDTSSSPVTPFSTGTYRPTTPSASSPSSGGSAGSDSPAAGTDFGGSATSPDDQVIPLRIAARAWATANGAGTPLATAGTTAGTLPVGTRLGSDDKRSFVRLMGSGKTLTLTEDPAAGRAAVNGTASVSACQITTGAWPEAEGESFDAAPKYDDKKCVAGTPDAQGVWTFDLSSFPSPADARGVALVPTPGGPVDFQVAFKR
jgi:hypothetical protein